MTRICFALLAFLLSLVAAGRRASADVSPYVSFSARLATADGTPIDGMRRIRFAVYAAETGGTALWSEESDVMVRGGFAYHPMGSEMAFDPALFRNGALYLEIAVGAEVFTPRLGLTSVPYALQASEALFADEADHAVEADHALSADNATTLGGLAASAYQRRVGATCAAGSSIRAIAADGTVTCEIDDDTNAGGTITGVTAGTGLSGGGTSGSVTVSANTAYLQRRVASCAVNSSIRAIAEDGSVTCEPDTDTDTNTDTAFSTCVWAQATGGMSAPVSLNVYCPSGKYPISGGCYGGATSSYVRRSSPSGGYGGAPMYGVSGWYCEFGAGHSDNSAFALCCSHY
ncbi:MAG: hypothetical protein K8M05_30625 [Deltaproteobacteria bacterium]|nr:hypothetical protein [Kofleriaceae bacterium]